MKTAGPQLPYYWLFTQPIPVAGAIYLFSFSNHCTYVHLLKLSVSCDHAILALTVHKNTPCSIYFRMIYARTELGSENTNKSVRRPLRINCTARQCRFAKEVLKQLIDKMCCGYVVKNFMRVVSIQFAIAL